MTKQPHNRTTSEYNSLALIFLVTFGILSLISIWLIYQQFTQVFTREGRCTVLSISTREDAIDTDNPTDGAKQYAIIFTVLLLTPDGQRLHVPGYYTSANYDASTTQTINTIKRTYAVGTTSTCGYTYLDPVGLKAIFQPAVPLEGFLFPGFFLLVSLIFVVICLRMMRRGPAPEPPFPTEDELESDESPVSESHKPHG
jgi:hypothetical protein